MHSENKKLLGNIFFLQILQITNYILPLITIPYLVRVLGPEKFGLIAFAQAIIQFFVIMTDYGFNYSATRKISVLRGDKDGVARVVNAVFSVKTIFLCTGFIVLMILVWSIPQLRGYELLYLFTFGTVLGSVLFPVWLFQGMEQMKYITYSNILAKLIFTVAVFICVKKETDYLYVPVLTSAGAIIAGLYAIRIAWKKFGILPRASSGRAMIAEIKEGWHVFVTVSLYALYTASIPVILGSLAGYNAVGFYSAGEKIVRATQQMLNPVFQVFYPHVSKMAADSRKKAIVFVRKIAGVVGLFTFILSCAILLAAPEICNVFLGSQFRGSISILRILSFLVFVQGLSQVFLSQIMLSFGDDRVVSLISVCGAGTCIISAFVLIPVLAGNGAALAVLLPEIVILTISARFVEQKYRFFTFKY